MKICCFLFALLVLEPCGSLTVGIVGAGPAGLTLAKTMCVDPSFQVTLFERSTDPRKSRVGGGLQLTSGAYALESHCGIDVRGIANEMRGVLSRDVDGETLLKLDIPQALKEADLPIDRGYAVMRSALQGLLYDSIANLGIVDIRLGTEVIDATTDGVLTLADGSQEQFDVIVGCDGVGSIIEKKCFFDTEEEEEDSRKPSGVEVLFCVCDDSQREGQQYFDQWLGDGAYALAATYGGERPGQLTDMIALCTASDEEEPPGKKKTSSWVDSQSELKDEARDVMRTAGLLKNSDLEPILDRATRFYRASVVHRNPRFGAWHRGRAVLCGDAAHAMPPFLGQGANQAIADACVLEKCLFQVGGYSTESLDDALRTYYDIRFWPTTRLLLNSRFLGFLETQKGPGAKFRDNFFRTTGNLGIAKQVFIDGATPRLGEP